MKIVVLDGHALNPGDLDWGDLAALGDLTVYERTAPDTVVERTAAAAVALTNKTLFSAATIAALPELRFIGVLATGYNVVDVAAAAAHGVVVSNVPEYSTDSVAQTVFAHILEFTQHVAAHDDGVRRGRWCASRDFAYWDFPLRELAGLTLGIVGYGRIGRRVAAIGRAFGMEILVATRTPPAAVETVGVDALFARADVVSLHCPLTPETAELVSAARLATMKPGAFLVNTGRGGLVDEAALAAALIEGRLAGAALDVLSTEPPSPDNPLLSAPNCTITPHIAWATRAARQRLMDATVANVRAFLAGTPRNVVSPQVPRGVRG